MKRLQIAFNILFFTITLPLYGSYESPEIFEINQDANRGTPIKPVVTRDPSLSVGHKLDLEIEKPTTQTDPDYVENQIKNEQIDGSKIIYLPDTSDFSNQKYLEALLFKPEDADKSTICRDECYDEIEEVCSSVWEGPVKGMVRVCVNTTKRTCYRVCDVEPPNA